jgi:hypothetical protein
VNASWPHVGTALTAHPSTPNDDVRSLAVQVSGAEDPDILVFQYSLVAEMSRVRVPVSGGSGRADGLWEHTCFEAFVVGDAPGYHEFNFSPSLDWAIYRFSAYREGISPVETERGPEVSVCRGVDGLELKAAVRLGHLADLGDLRHLRIALAAVIEDDNGRLSYWGLRHAPGKPDFHHPNGFALEVTR